MRFTETTTNKASAFVVHKSKKHFMLRLFKHLLLYTYEYHFLNAKNRSATSLNNTLHNIEHLCTTMPKLTKRMLRVSHQAPSELIRTKWEGTKSPYRPPNIKNMENHVVEQFPGFMEMLSTLDPNLDDLKCLFAHEVTTFKNHAQIVLDAVITVRLLRLTGYQFRLNLMWQERYMKENST